MAGLSVNNITLPQRQDKIRYRIDFSVPRFHSLCLTTFCPLQPWLRDTAERERMANNIGLQLQLSRSIRATYHTHNLRYPSGAGPRDTERHGDTDPGLCDGGSQEAATHNINCP